jgi:two-component system, OmpR family, sensor kinase
MLLLAPAGEERFLRPGVVELRPFVRDLVQGLADVAPRRLTVGAMPDTLLEGDGDRLAQALRNLLRNAIAHTDAEGVVALDVEADAGRVALRGR